MYLYNSSTSKCFNRQKKKRYMYQSTHSIYPPVIYELLRTTLEKEITYITTLS